MVAFSLLIRKLKQADGPCRKLDHEIERIAFGDAAWIDVPAYTSSFDASLILLERKLPVAHIGHAPGDFTYDIHRTFGGEYAVLLARSACNERTIAKSNFLAIAMCLAVFEELLFLWPTMRK